jgi:acetyltransferase-like isoleucine patch superfamily enzyme
MGIRSKILFLSLDTIARFWGLSPMSTIFFLLPPWTLPLLLKRFGAQIGEDVIFRQGTRFINLSSGGFSNLQIGSNCYLGYECMFDLTGKILIEDEVTLAPRCTILTHQDVGHRPLSKAYPATKGVTILRKGCWLGANVTVLNNVVIGENSVVAACAVVTKNVEKNTAVGGVPARLIKEKLIQDQSNE